MTVLCRINTAARKGGPDREQVGRTDLTQSMAHACAQGVGDRASKNLVMQTAMSKLVIESLRNCLHILVSTPAEVDDDSSAIWKGGA